MDECFTFGVDNGSGSKQRTMDYVHKRLEHLKTVDLSRSPACKVESDGVADAIAIACYGLEIFSFQVDELNDLVSRGRLALPYDGLKKLFNKPSNKRQKTTIGRSINNLNKHRRPTV